MTKYVNNNGVSEMWLNIKNWVTSQLLGYSQTGHTHTKSQITDLDLSNFVDKTSNQTVGGQKLFVHGATGLGRDSYHFASVPYGKNTPPANASYQYVFFHGNTASQGFTNSWYGGYLEQCISTNGTARGRWLVRDTSESAVGLELFVNGNVKQVRPQGNNIIDLGTSTNKWKSIYSNTYYLGNTAFGNIVTHNASEFAQVGHTHSASEITDLQERWDYDSNSNAILVRGGSDVWTYDQQNNSIIVS